MWALPTEYAETNVDGLLDAGMATGPVRKKQLDEHGTDVEQPEEGYVRQKVVEAGPYSNRVH